MKPLFSLALAFAVTASFAQTEVTIATGPSNAQQVWYSLENGVQATTDLAAWDLAFEINSFNSSVLVNTAKGLSVWQASTALADWSSITSPNEAGWTAIYNSEIDWSAGALTYGNNLDQANGFNVGWGDYSMITHAIVGAKVYVIKFPGDIYKKLRINSLATGTYSFTYADLDGGNEQNATLVKSAFPGKNFGYFSFATNAAVDLEPAADAWDLVFTKYTSIIPSPAPTPYAVAGVLQNKSVLAAQVDGVPTGDALWTSQPLDSAINIIGYDWKTYNASLMQYEYAQDRTYFVKDRAGSIWKLVFIGYGGGSTGTMTFTQELVSATGMAETAENGLALYPNPVTDGELSLLLDEPLIKGALQVVDRSGRIVKEAQIAATGAAARVLVDLRGLANGIYIVRLASDSGVRAARVVVE
ncbi:MAG: T9SS type A sorting domain-containing protein [Flavobacteriales bacterium]|jgi:hypothetical protein|nr:MAG: T9SS type A sorting domain-containing protein [Flavobacteriales bacterium]